MTNRAHLLTQDDVTPGPIGANEAGIILQADGSFQVFNTFREIDPENPNPVQVEMMTKIVGLSVALKDPEVMQMLVNKANDPTYCAQDTFLEPRSKDQLN